MDVIENEIKVIFGQDDNGFRADIYINDQRVTWTEVYDNQMQVVETVGRYLQDHKTFITKSYFKK